LSVPPCEPGKGEKNGVLLRNRVLLYSIGKGTPTVWNLPRIFLDALPSVNLRNGMDIAKQVLCLQHSERQKALLSVSTIERVDSISSLKELISTMIIKSIGEEGDIPCQVYGIHGKDGNVHTVIFVTHLRLDNAANAPILDCWLAPLTHEILEASHFDESILDMKIPFICNEDDQGATWHAFITAAIERCRTWSHDTSRCEYISSGRIPMTSGGVSSQALCSCRGTAPPEIFRDTRNWDRFSGIVKRAAITPLFVPTYLETFSESLLRFVRKNKALAGRKTMRVVGSPPPVCLAIMIRRKVVHNFRGVKIRIKLYERDTERVIRTRLFSNGVRDKDSVEECLKTWRKRKDEFITVEGDDPVDANVPRFIE
ncbi:hypothetical protein HDU67_001201, partial [Dinochytrium kinnereticum]